MYTKMFELLILFIVFAGTNAVASANRYNDDYEANPFAQTSSRHHRGHRRSNYGYNSGGSDYSYQPFVPNFIDDIDGYQRSLNDYLADANDYHTRAYTSTYASPNAYTYASASLAPDDQNIQQQIASQNQYLLSLQARAAAQHEALTSEIQQQIADNIELSQGGIPAPAPAYSGASAAYGNNGARHHTAYNVPSNPEFPNVNQRFDGSDGGSSFGGYPDASGGGFGAGSGGFGAGGGGFGAGAGGFNSFPAMPAPVMPVMPAMPAMPAMPVMPPMPAGATSVSTSSFSASSSLNGKKKSTGGSVTTVNDNGKFTRFATSH